MKKLITVYTFTPSAKTILFRENITLSQVLLITNIRTNTIIYNFADPALGGTLSGRLLTLNYDTSAMLAGDPLQIFVEGDDQQPNLFRRVVELLSSPVGFDKSQNRARVTATLESGTVSTVSNISQLDTIQARLLPMNANAQAWFITNRNRIT